MANSLQTPQDEDYYNRTQQLYDRELQGSKNIAQQDQRDAFENEFGGENYKKDGTSGDIGRNIADVKEKEENGLYHPEKSRQKVVGKGWLKRKGPLTALITLFFGGAVTIGGIFGAPSLLLVNMSEVISGKLNTSLASLESRSDRIIRLKLQGTTSGVCSSRVSLLCKYTSLSKDEIAGFKQQGIEIKDSTGNIIDPESADTPNKSKPASYRFNGQDISPKDFPGEMAKNTTLRSAVQDGIKFNAKYGSLTGRGWRGASRLLGLSKQSPFSESDNTDEKRLAKVEETTKDGTTKGSARTLSVGDEDPACGGKCTDPKQVEAINEGNAKASGLIADSSIPDGTNALNEVDTVAKGTVSGLEAAGNTLKVTGYLDNICSVRGTINAVGFAAKTVRYAQLARYAMIFLTTASMIKAGTARADDVNYLGNNLTKTITTTASDGKQTTSKAATDSLAYRNLAYGDTGVLDTNASQYMVAGGFTGVLAGLTSTVEGLLGGKEGAKTTCGILSNPIVQVGSLVAGIGMFFIPGAGAAAFGVKEALQVAGSASLMAAQFVLPSMLKDIVAGTIINKETYGEASGSALVSGSGAMFSSVAQFGGNAPLTPDQAVAYTSLQNQTLARYASQDQLAFNPLDPTHANTFMGKIVTQISRYSGNLSSLHGILTMTGSMITSSLQSIITPYSKADGALLQNYTTCQDETYKALNNGRGVATDLFCNIIRGIPPQYLNAAPDPDTLLQEYIRAGNTDESGQPQNEYATFVDHCINRQQPLGEDGENNGNDGSECFINNQETANKYIFYIDTGAIGQMENGYDG